MLGLYFLSTKTNKIFVNIKSLLTTFYFILITKDHQTAKDIN